MRRSNSSALMALLSITLTGGCVTKLAPTTSSSRHEQLLSYGLEIYKNLNMNPMRLTLDDNTGPHHYKLEDNGRYTLTSSPDCLYCKNNK